MGIISFLTNCEFASSNSKTKAKYLQMLRSGFQGEEHYLLKWQQAPLVCPSQEVAVSITPKIHWEFTFFYTPTKENQQIKQG